MIENNEEKLIEELTDEELEAADVTGSDGLSKATYSNTGCKPAPCGC